MPQPQTNPLQREVETQNTNNYLKHVKQRLYISFSCYVRQSTRARSLVFISLLWSQNGKFTMSLLLRNGIMSFWFWGHITDIRTELQAPVVNHSKSRLLWRLLTRTAPSEKNLDPRCLPLYMYLHLLTTSTNICSRRFFRCTFAVSF